MLALGVGVFVRFPGIHVVCWHWPSLPGAGVSVFIRLAGVRVPAGIGLFAVVLDGVGAGAGVSVFI